MQSTVYIHISWNLNSYRQVPQAKMSGNIFQFALLFMFTLVYIYTTGVDGESKRDMCAGKSHELKTTLRRIEKLTSRLKKHSVRLENIDRDLILLKKRRDRTNVAFSAQVQPTYNNLNPGQTIKFPRVILNEGGGFNAQSGTFVSPRRGTYVFTCAIMTGKGSALELGLQLNNQYKMMLYPDNRNGGSYNTATNSVVLGRSGQNDEVARTWETPFLHTSCLEHILWVLAELINIAEHERSSYIKYA